jgi:simple sugar transport system ATP-binding protein
VSDAGGAGATRAALELTAITKRFGAATALDGVSMRVAPGTVHALLGENGAGKTTLMRIAFGLIHADAGTVAVSGEQVDFSWPADAIAAGIGMVHQHFTNVPAMTVAENVALGHTGRYSTSAAAQRVVEIGRRTGLALDPSARAADLAVSAQQRLEIVKALGRNARLLILDEPTAVLAPDESSELRRWLREFANEGNAVVLITHKLDEALAVADDVTVLRRGTVALAAPARGLDADSLTVAMLGDLPTPDVAADVDAPGATVARIEDVEARDPRGVPTLQHASLEVRAGEIVGVAAVEGAGQHELLRLFASRERPRSGKVTTPENVAFIPADRHREALILDFDPAENLALRGAGERSGMLRWKELASRASTLIDRFDVRGARSGKPMQTLSGGNQQKFVLARELSDRPTLVVADNPTRGLDIRATRDVHARLRLAASQGAGVIVYSSDLDEVLALATRVVVVHAGRVHDVPRDRAVVGRAMLGVA